MGKIIKFRSKQAVEEERHARVLMQISDEIDTLVLGHILDGQVDPKDLAGLLAHRLGNLIRHLDESDREKLWEVCATVLRRQAKVDVS